MDGDIASSSLRKLAAVALATNVTVLMERGPKRATGSPNRTLDVPESLRFSWFPERTPTSFQPHTECKSQWTQMGGLGCFKPPQV
jgi:hypothetical protein